MSRWTKWVAAETDHARLVYWVNRWPKPQAGIHARLAARWQHLGYDRVTGLWWARRSDKPKSRVE